MVKHRSLAVLAALLIALGALPTSSAAQVPLPACSVVAANSVPSASNFALPPNTLAVLRGIPGYAQVVTRVPWGVQANVTGGSGDYWVYNQWNCTEDQLEQVARDYAWRHGLVVANIYGLQSVAIIAVGYYPAPVAPIPVQPPFIPQPQPVVPPFPYPFQPAPIAFPQPLQPCGPLNYTTVSPDPGRVYGAAAIRVTFEDYQIKVVMPVSGDQTATIREAKTIEVWELPGCDSSVVGPVANSLIAQGGSIAHGSAPSWVQNRFSLVRR